MSLIKIRYKTGHGRKEYYISEERFDSSSMIRLEDDNDLKKNKFCFKNNIPLIRIPYDAKYTIDDLKLKTTRFLLIPENEMQYYNKI